MGDAIGTGKNSAGAQVDLGTSNAQSQNG
jgi:hypothetical protein